MRRRGGRESTRLARALDAGAATGTGDPAVDELVNLAERLSRVHVEVPLTQQFRVETRVRLLALAEQQAVAERRGGSRSPTRRSQVPLWRRQIAFAVAVVSVLLATTGLLTLASGDALPGETLYAVKRGAEQVQLGVTWDRDERGLALLHFAETRLDEVTELVHGPAALVAAVPGQPLAAGAGSRETVVRALADMDRQTAAGVSLLTASAVERSDEATLKILPTWATGQRGLLDALVAEMTEPEQDRAQASLALLDRVGNRARMLELGLPCRCLVDSPADELGPVPCTSCASVPGGRPGDSAAPSPSTTGAGPTSGSLSRSAPSPTRVSPTS